MTALVCGIISLVIALGGGPAGFGWVGSVCGILAIIFGAKGMKGSGDQKKYSKAGLILGIIALCWGIIVTIACVACIGAAAAGAGLFGFFN